MKAHGYYKLTSDLTPKGRDLNMFTCTNKCRAMWLYTNDIVGERVADPLYEVVDDEG